MARYAPSPLEILLRRQSKIDLVRETNSLKATEHSWGWWLTLMVPAPGRQRQKNGRKPAKLHSERLPGPTEGGGDAKSTSGQLSVEITLN